MKKTLLKLALALLAVLGSASAAFAEGETFGATFVKYLPYFLGFLAFIVVIMVVQYINHKRGP